MLKTLLNITVLLLPLVLTACQTESGAKIGSEAWQAWVESIVNTGDGQGHGPDVGSQEWCDVVEYRLFGRHSNERPCSPSWNSKVNDTLSAHEPISQAGQ